VNRNSKEKENKCRRFSVVEKQSIKNKYTDERRRNRGQESRGRMRDSSFLATNAFTDLCPKR
jgi:hypothetical protein